MCFDESGEEIVRNLGSVGIRLAGYVRDGAAAALEHVLAGNAGYRLVQECKMRGISLFTTSLIGHATPETEISETHISPLADTWIHLTFLVRAGERNRALTIVKSRARRVRISRLRRADTPPPERKS